MLGIGRDRTRMVTPEEALPGRSTPIPTASEHHVTGTALSPSPGEGEATAMFAMGCFWEVERLFWTHPGVRSTMVGYAGGFTPNPTYDEVCSGRTGHAEVVRLHFDPLRVSYRDLLAVFWERHDPTQGMRQGKDRGTQYRSAIFALDAAQQAAAEESLQLYQRALAAKGLGQITTQILPAPPFYFAESYHQQYLAKNPGGYCGLGGTGVTCPTPLS